MVGCASKIGYPKNTCLEKIELCTLNIVTAIDSIVNILVVVGGGT